MVLKSKMKWVGLVGLFLSAISLFVHFLLARFTEGAAASEFHSSITIFPRRAIGESLNFSKTVNFTYPPPHQRSYLSQVSSALLKCSLSLSLSLSCFCGARLLSVFLFLGFDSFVVFFWESLVLALKVAISVAFVTLIFWGIFLGYF